MSANGSHSRTTPRIQPRRFVIENASSPSTIHMNRRSRERHAVAEDEEGEGGEVHGGAEPGQRPAQAFATFQPGRPRSREGAHDAEASSNHGGQLRRLTARA